MPVWEEEKVANKRSPQMFPHGISTRTTWFTVRRRLATLPRCVNSSDVYVTKRKNHSFVALMTKSRHEQLSLPGSLSTSNGRNDIYVTHTAHPRSLHINWHKSERMLKLWLGEASEFMCIVLKCIVDFFSRSLLHKLLSVVRETISKKLKEKT